MQPLYLRWHNKVELKHILQALQERGYRNLTNLTTDYRFPVIVVDRKRKIFYESHTSYIAAHLTTGTLKLYSWPKISALL